MHVIVTYASKPFCGRTDIVYHCDVKTFVLPVTRSGHMSNKFGRMQESKTTYTDIKLYCILHIENKDIELMTNKKRQQLHAPMRYLQGLPHYRFNMMDS